MKKENFKEDQFMHDPKKLKNEKKPNNSQAKHDDDDSLDEEAAFDQTLRQGSRDNVDTSARDQGRQG
ncbi:MAG: hypothetical protein M3Q07_25230 [Pseudobdellovibrionaceae bacterium]|nr:hypothetical protein [Pseudobdellovibrionaceae bacterium]